MRAPTAAAARRAGAPMLATLLLVLVAVAHLVSGALVHTRVVRAIDLSSQGSRVVRERVTFTLHYQRNESRTDEPPMGNYMYHVPAERAPRLIGLRATVDGKEVVDAPRGLDRLQNKLVVALRLPAGIKSGDTAEIVVDTVFLGDVMPRPREIKQTDTQKMWFESDLGIDSRYPTENVQVTVKLPTYSRPESFAQTRQPAVYSGNTVKYGPYAINPVGEPLTVHYDAPRTGLVCNSWHRAVWVRSFGKSIEVEENVRVTHDGARLLPHFNRQQYMHQSQYGQVGNLIPELALALPASATEVYFRDEIGNVSTSNLHATRRATTLQMRPRFPLAGGWTYNWVHGYAARGADFVKELGNARYALTVPLVQGFPGVVVEDLHMDLVLPEGATDIAVTDAASGEPITDWTTKTTKYYFDTTGRPTVVLRNTMLLDSNAAVRVTYTLTWVHKLQKPAAAIAFLAVVGAIVSMLASLDLRIGARRGNAAGRVVDLCLERERIYARLARAHLSFTTAQERAALEQAVDRATTAFESTLKALQRAAADVQAGADAVPGAAREATQAELAHRIVKLAEARASAVLEAMRVVLKASAPGADAKVVDAARTKVGELKRVEEQLHDEIRVAVLRMQKA
ncbi:hypothetical protein GGF32_009535 [Allomyces javanicus]|nr:hypothetical protein GGF32_009535 [Allomyces javanicus]